MSLEKNIARSYDDLDAVYAAGKKAEREAFWDFYQENGNRRAYSYAFGGAGWTEATFKPKYDIVATEASYMFAGSRMDLDLSDLLERLGISLDFSAATALTGTFNNTKFIRIGEIDASSATSITSTFSTSTKLVTIDKLKVSDKAVASSAFGGCSSLENIVIEGTIGKNGFSWQASTKLSRASIASIIAALSTTTKELTVTFSEAAVNKAFETAAGKNDGSSSRAWKALENTRQNWKIGLA